MLIRTPADLGAVIRDRRRQLDLDQATLAKKIGVSRQWIIGIERGRSRAALGLVLRALDALGIRLNTSAADNSGRTAKPSVDIDAIVTSARKDK
jgi:HTH-type transcriptional regulator/antitoxin HipB